jgi:hypothetical protein
MPSWFPENNTILPKDNELRALAKWCDCLYQVVGNVAGPFPEGSIPLASDGEDRLAKKINLMRCHVATS